MFVPLQLNLMRDSVKEHSMGSIHGAMHRSAQSDEFAMDMLDFGKPES